MQIPSWLDDCAKKYWQQTCKLIDVTPAQRETFAVLCQTYADYRQAPDLAQKKVFLDYYLRWAKEFGLTPKSIKPKKIEESKDELDEFLTRG